MNQFLWWSTSSEEMLLLLMLLLLVDLDIKSPCNRFHSVIVSVVVLKTIFLVSQLGIRYLLVRIQDINLVSWLLVSLECLLLCLNQGKWSGLLWAITPLHIACVAILNGPATFAILVIISTDYSCISAVDNLSLIFFIIFVYLYNKNSRRFYHIVRHLRRRYTIKNKIFFFDTW